MQLQVEEAGQVEEVRSVVLGDAVAVGPLEVEGEKPSGAMEGAEKREKWQCVVGEEVGSVEVVVDLPMDLPVHQTF